jgi:hypothetical protein
MKTSLLISTLALLFSISVSAQFQKSVGVPNEHYHDLNQTIIQDGSNHIAVAANLFDSTMTNQVFTLKRVNQAGNVVWVQKYDNASFPNARVFDIVSYLDIIVVTGSIDVGSTKRTFIARILATTGAVMNVKFYDIVSPNFNSRGLHIEYTQSDADGDSIADPGFVVSGFFSACYNVDINCSSNLGFVLRTDDNLNLLWASELDTAVPATADFDFINGVTETSDGFFLTGSATGLDPSNITQQGVLAHKIDFQGVSMWDKSYLFGNSQDVSVDAYYDAGSQKIYALTNYSVSHYFGVTVFDNGTGTVDTTRSWYASSSDFNRYGFNIMESLTNPNNLVIAGYDRDENWMSGGTSMFGNSNVFVYEFEKATGNQVGISYQFLVPHVEPTGDEFNFWNGQMPLIYYPDMSFMYRNSTGTVNNYFHVGYRRNVASSFTEAELFKTDSNKRNICDNLELIITPNPITMWAIQVFAGPTPAFETNMTFNITGFNYTEVACTEILGVNDVETETGFIYPNPVDDTLFTTVVNATSYSILDALGRTVSIGTFSQSDSIYMGDLTSGLYFIIIENDIKQSQSFKFIKK